MISDHCSLVLRKNCLSVLLIFFCIQRTTQSKKLNVFIEILDAQQIKKNTNKQPEIFFPNRINSKLGTIEPFKRLTEKNT